MIFAAKADLEEMKQIQPTPRLEHRCQNLILLRRDRQKLKGRRRSSPQVCRGPVLGPSYRRSRSDLAVADKP